MNKKELLGEADSCRDRIQQFIKAVPGREKAADNWYYQKAVNNNSPAEKICYLTAVQKDSYEEALSYMKQQAGETGLPVTEELICRLHYLIYQREEPETAGRYRQETVTAAGGGYQPPEASEIPRLMGHFINQMETSAGMFHPLEYAVLCHKRLMDIQPFQEGSDKIALMFLNLLLLRHGYGMAWIPGQKQQEYVKALEASRGELNPDVDRFVLLMLECIINTEKECLEMLSNIKRV